MRARSGSKDLGVVAALAMCLGGCLLKPDRPGGANPDARPDGTVRAAPVVRKIGSAWYSSIEHSPGMSMAQYSISTGNIANGELVLFIANVDNGSDSVWTLPTPSFHQIVQSKYGGDGQTFFAAWTIANGEPPLYAQPYGPGIISADAAITLLAIDGADPAAPISISTVGSTGEDPVVVSSPGVTTAAPNSLLIFAAGADWLAQDSTAAFTLPANFDMIDAFGDRGGLTFEWTTQLVASAVQPMVGATGPHTGMISTAPPRAGEHWTLDLAIAPTL